MKIGIKQHKLGIIEITTDANSFQKIREKQRLVNNFTHTYPSEEDAFISQWLSKQIK
jgi:hypothetical protein